jgi:fumarate reductase flavoprotein subunit
VADTPLDLIVVGSGLAGLAAGLRARELGLTVLVLEASSDPAGSSNSRMSGARYHAAGLHPEAGGDIIASKAEALTEGIGDPAVTRAWANACGRSYRWLRRQGIGFAVLRGVPVITPIRPNRRGEVWAGYGGDVAVRRLSSRLRLAGGGVRAASRATAIRRVASAGSWEVDVDRGGKRSRLRGANVALADGGFQSNLDMLREHAAVEHPEKLVQRGAGSGFGDGAAMALSAGGYLINPEALYATLIHRDGRRDVDLRHYPMLDALAAGSCVVDAAGARICDESVAGGIGIANRIARLPDPLGAWVIFDRERWETVGRRSQIVPPNPNLQLARATIVGANEVGELAAATGLDAANLAASLHGAAAEGSGIGPLRGDIKPPYFAVPLAVGLTFTMGGVAIAPDARVLTGDQTRIPGLYAIGATAGGLSGGPKPGYVGGLSIAVTLGMLAAEAMAQGREIVQ